MRGIEYRGIPVNEQDAIAAHEQEQGDGTFVFGWKVRKNQDGTAWLVRFDKDILVKTDTIGKYVGIRDDVGKDIYEGDIVYAVKDWTGTYEHCGNGAVRWDEEEGMFVVDFPKNQQTEELFLLDVTVEGNIYQGAPIRT